MAEAVSGREHMVPTDEGASTVDGVDLDIGHPGVGNSRGLSVNYPVPRIGLPGGNPSALIFTQIVQALLVINWGRSHNLGISNN